MRIPHGPFTPTVDIVISTEYVWDGDPPEPKVGLVRGVSGTRSPRLTETDREGQVSRCPTYFGEMTPETSGMSSSCSGSSSDSRYRLRSSRRSSLDRGK